MAQATILIGDIGKVYNLKVNGNFTELYGLVSSTLTNVSLSTLTSNDLLQWSGSNWVNRSLSTAGIADKATADAHYAEEVDETDTDATKDKHISNALAKSYSDHIASVLNPHGVTHTQVGSATAQWNASKIQDVTVDNSNIGNRKILGYNSSSTNIEYLTLVYTDVEYNTAYWNALKIKDVTVDDISKTTDYYLRYDGANIIYDVADASKIQGVTVDDSNIGDSKILQYNSSETKLEYVDVTSISSFLSLSDTPSSYSGQAGYILKVNGSENAVEFGTISAGNVDGGSAATSGDLIKHRADTTANWTTYSTVVIADGNFALEQNASGFYNAKIGNGTDTYSDLPFISLSFNISSVSNKDKLQYNSATENWDNIADTIDNLKNVTIAGAVQDELLTYDNGSASWVNTTNDTPNMKYMNLRGLRTL